MRPPTFSLIVTSALVALAMQVSGAAAAGAYNDFSCRPSRTHPIPVVMVHGAGIAGIDMARVSWSYQAPRLARAGYCVFAPDYGEYAGIWGRDTVQHDAAQLKRYITRVLRTTHARHISIVSHSAGGAVARWYLKFLADDTRVRDLVAIAPPNHVTRLKHACPLLCTQLNRGTIIRRLNRGGELLAGVDYTVIESAVDGAIVPYTAAFLHGSRRQLTNVLVQRTCPSDHANHIGLLFDPVVLQWVENALGRRGPANPSFRPCAEMRLAARSS